MSHMLAGENLGLITTRMTKDEWDCSAAGQIMGHKSLAAYDSNSNDSRYSSTAKQNRTDTRQDYSMLAAPTLVQSSSALFRLSWG